MSAPPLRRWIARAAATGLAGLALDGAVRGNQSVAAAVLSRLLGQADDAFVRGARVSEGGMLYRGFGRVEYAHAPIPDAVADPAGFAGLTITWLGPWRRGTEHGDGRAAYLITALPPPPPASSCGPGAVPAA